MKWLVVALLLVAVSFCVADYQSTASYVQYCHVLLNAWACSSFPGQNGNPLQQSHDAHLFLDQLVRLYRVWD